MSLQRPWRGASEREVARAAQVRRRGEQVGVVPDEAWLTGAAAGLLTGSAISYVGDYFPYDRRGWASGWVKWKGHWRKRERLGTC